MGSFPSDSFPWNEPQVGSTTNSFLHVWLWLLSLKVTLLRSVSDWRTLNLERCFGKYPKSIIAVALNAYKSVSCSDLC